MRNVINSLTKYSLMLLTLLLLSTTLWAQNSKNITGTVLDDFDEPLAGATVVIKNSTKGVMTDLDGKFVIDVNASDILVFSFIGLEDQEVKVGDQTSLRITMQEKINEFDEVTVVAFAKQKKESVISSISTVKPSELKIPVSNLTNALGGRIAGIISYQQSGEPGRDNAQFFIRGVTTFGYKQDPLILIDNVELTSDDLARLNVDDIEQFSIMKDATATALYGARGANGVIFVTTKEGREGKLKISLRAEGSLSEPVKMVKMADPITYMRLSNEADYNDVHRGMYNIFSREKIERTMSGINPYHFPAVDWNDELFSKNTFNHRYNLSISGGGKLARYYIAANFNKDDGILRNDKLNNFNSNIDLKKYGIRSNINIDITKTTELILRINGTFDDYSGPIDSGNSLFNKAMRSSPVLFPKSFPSQGQEQSSTHVLFGNVAPDGNHINPYADMVRGYKEYNRTQISAQLEAKQDLSIITEGLSARALVSTSRYSYTDLTRTYNPFYYNSASYDPRDNTYGLIGINPLSGTEYLDYNPGSKDISTTNYVEAAATYAKDIDVHGLSAMLVFQLQDRKISNADNLQKSLAYRNMGLSGRLTYAFDSRYFAEFNFGYNGSERFAKNERFGFFPSIGAGYMISNEEFWEPWREKVNKLKLKLTYGLVGNDAIGSEDDRFFYLPYLHMDDGDKGQQFGTNFQNGSSGVTMQRYANPLITWERSKKLNAGFELGLFNGVVDIDADYFHESRDRILQDRSFIPSTMGLSAGVKANLGEATSQGVDFSINVNYIGKRDFWATGRVNFTYATSKFDVYEEPDYSLQGTPWNSRIGRSLSQQMGFIAERLFIDEADIANSPTQFGEYKPGDIKYKDIDGDGKITDKDKVYLGWPTTPEVTYGFGFSAGYKNLDMSAFFQGNARVTIFLEPNKIAPFIDGLSGDDKFWAGLPSDKVIVTNLMDEIASNHWSESNRDSYAFWPRLSTGVVDNNSQRSTWWMRDGSFMRLKTLEVGYSLPRNWINKLNMESCRFYVNGNNLLTFSKFKLWDPEMGSNGLNYPLQRVYNIGVNINF